MVKIKEEKEVITYKNFFNDFRKLNISINQEVRYFYLFVMFLHVLSKYNSEFKDKIYQKIFNKRDSENYIKILTYLKTVNPRLFNEFPNVFTLDNSELSLVLDLITRYDVLIDISCIGYFYENCLCQDRKEKGAFYTPKEIVSYMVQETQKEHDKRIFEKLGVTDIEDCRKNNKLLEYLTELKTITILDPACGGSVFLIRYFEELCNIYETYFKELNIDLSDKPYKAMIISNNLFGIDINPEACLVSKMCFFILLSEKELYKNYVFNILTENTLILSNEEIFDKFYKNRSDLNLKKEVLQ